MSVQRWVAFIAVVLALIGIGTWMLLTRDALPAAQRQLHAAYRLLAEGDTDRAAATARQLLAAEPLSGNAFAVVARAEAGTDEVFDAEDAQRHRVAARRAPRDAGVRNRLAREALLAGDYPLAIQHLDALLTVTQAPRQPLLELITQLAQDPAFAEAMGAHLAEHPRWRNALLASASRSRLPGAADQLHAALRAHGELSATETNRWIEGMLREGRWGDAYARWIGTLDRLPERLPTPWNGDFATMPGSAGFDWRLRRTNGVVVDRVERVDAGTRGHALRLRFLGRPVAATGIEVPLLLAPGRYRLTFAAHTEAFHSDQGLEWALVCRDNRTRIARGARIRQAAGWQALALDLEVPPGEACDGQWLRLLNPAPRGVAQTLRGQVQLADVVIRQQAAEASPATGVNAALTPPALD